jgi:hypothetical protein
MRLGPGAFKLRQLGSARSRFRRTGLQHGVRKRILSTMQIVCDFSAADGFCRDAHVDIRREAQRQTRPRRRLKLHVAAQTRTLVAWTAVLALSLRVAAREDTAAIVGQDSTVVRSRL